MHKKISIALVLISILLLNMSSQAQNKTDIFGKWKTIDDVSGEALSIVEIYEKNGKAYGKIISLMKEEDKGAKCIYCDKNDKRYNEPIEGLEIITELKKKTDSWDDGEILDPNNGKTYSCKLWVENGKLQVRGYIGYSWMGRTQIWQKAD